MTIIRPYLTFSFMLPLTSPLYRGSVTTTQQRGADSRLTWVGGPPLPRGRRPGHAPRRVFGDLFLALAGLGMGITLALVITGESGGSFHAPGGAFIAGGRLAGFTGAYLLLLMLVLVTRLPWLERSLGQDRLIQWHRRIAPWALVLIGLHIVLVTLGYAQLAKSGFLHQFWQFLTSYPDMLAAAVAFGLLVMGGVTSIRMARRRLKYETWWVVHLYLYLALALAFAHQIVTGVSFIGHPLTRAVWIAVWAATAGMVLVYRVLLPVTRSLRHQLKVVSVTQEAPGVVSVVCSGRQISWLAVSGGQFFQWRFLTRELWWHAHPYSLSALPRAPFIRVTVKGLGDQSRALAHLKPGTRVFIEGPYGALTRHARRSDRVVLIGAGVGVTPLRALLEDLPTNVDAVLVVRATTPEEIVHREELIELTRKHKGQYHEVLGERSEVRMGASTLSRLIPDIARRDVYVCGPEGFNELVISGVSRLGVPSSSIHEERFSF
jgi:predicted ferric reductase